MIGMICSELDYICLECGKEFKNEFDLAVCKECLEKEREYYKKGILSKYNTINLFLKKNDCLK